MNKIRFLQEIEDAGEYSKKLLACLKETKRQYAIAGRHDREANIRRDPWAIIHWETNVPPFVQSLAWELINLGNEEHRLLQQGKKGSPEHRQVKIREEVVQILIHHWVLKILARRPRVMALFQKRKVEPIIGGRWKLLFVQQIQVSLSKKGDEGA